MKKRCCIAMGVLALILLLMSQASNFQITGAATSGDCKPNYTCAWGPCLITEEHRLYCFDKNECGYKIIQDVSEPCTFLEKCLDNDGDGFGVGETCLGKDPDDLDERIIGSINQSKIYINETELELQGSLEDQKSLIPQIMIIILSLIFVIIITIIFEQNKKKKDLKKKEEGKNESEN